MSIGTFFKAGAAGIKAHKPEIMIGTGLLASAGAIFVAVKETPACLEAFDKAVESAPTVKETLEDGQEIEIPIKLGWKDKLIIYGKHYWLAGVLEIAAFTLIIGGSKMRLSSYTAILTAFGITKAELADLKRVIDEQPDNWKKKFVEKMAESHVDHSDVEDIPAEAMSNTEVPMALPLFWDDQAKVYFRISEEDLRDAVAELTHEIMTDPFQTTSMNDWMRVLGHEEVSCGDYRLLTQEDNSGNALKYNQIGVKEAPNGEPCRMMRFSWEYHTDLRGLGAGAYGDI